MTRTNTTTLTPPADLLSYLRSHDRSDVLVRRPVAVDFDWWNQRLAHYALSGGPIGSANGSTLTRDDVFTAGADDPLRLLWLALAWGAGTPPRNCDRRMKAVAELGDSGHDTLAAAAEVAKADPVRAFEVLSPAGRPAIPYLGPAFFTKFLYFASGSATEPPSAFILDSRVAASLKRLGWHSLVPSGGWSSLTYRRYIELIARWSATASEAIGRDVAGDEVELWLFRPAG